MARSHRGGNRTQQFLLPPSLDDWLPQDHLARFVVGAVDQLDLRGFARPERPDGRGRRAYDPRMLVALVLLAWCEGVRSSRQIERRCVEHISYRWVAGNEAPDHTTLSRFVKERAADIDALFAQVLRLAFTAGMGRVGVVAIDSTRVAADASPQAGWSRPRLEAEVRRIREEHQANDAADDARHGAARGDELPGGLADPARRDARIAEALRQIEAEDAAAREAHEARMAERTGRGGRPPTPPAPSDRKGNVTDPDCRVMRGPRGFGPAYNAQVAVSTDQLVLAAQVCQDGTDNAQFLPLAAAALDSLQGLRAAKPKALVADNGYWSPDATSATLGPEVLIPPRRDDARPKLATRGPIPASATVAQRMERRLATKGGRAAYRLRAITAEPVFGQIKGPGGLTRFRRRGLAAARSEWMLAATAHNLRKMWRAGVRFA